ncbi:lipase [Streptomyces tateyamensis]|uniref:Lipase n=1 Tax=Streptomyces tateyamensis TaxID=565073 RepID=A0A2V4N8K4_9ACTN|nr:SGNH/GDSL hydrolase family protein [Streptomyces tateyamensis]PYC68203.1 lipase [Streptomyces tateyamensis]
MTAPTLPDGALAPAPRARALCFVALGDSVTEGVGAPAEGGWRGWPTLLAPSLASAGDTVEHHNLAVSGAQCADLTDRQLHAALALRPQVAAVVVGGNDTLRAGFEITRTVAALHTTLGELGAAGALVLTACLPDPGALLGLPGALRRPLARRMAAVNTAVHELSERHQAIHLHLAELPWLRDRALLSADRLHPSPLGHLLIARQFHALLAARGLPVGAPPAELAAPPAPSRAADLWWLLTRGTAWLARRSVDLIPGLCAVAAVESFRTLCGRAPAMDARAVAEARAAVASLP